MFIPNFNNLILIIHMVLLSIDVHLTSIIASVFVPVLLCRLCAVVNTISIFTLHVNESMQKNNK